MEATNTTSVPEHFECANITENGADEEYTKFACQTHFQLKFIFSGVGLMIVGCVGTLMNILSIAVLLRRRMRTCSINILLTALQISDLLVVIGLIFSASLESIFEWISPSHAYMIHVDPWAQIIAHPTSLAAGTASIYFTVLITIERYIAVCHPLKAALFSTKRAIKWCILVTIFSLVFSVPFLWDVGIRFDEESGNYVSTDPEFSMTPIYDYYLGYGTLVILYLVPFTILIVLNICIHRQIRKSVALRKSIRRRTSSNIPTREQLSSDDNSLTFLLFSIVITFVVCNSFQLINNLSWALKFRSGIWIYWFVLPIRKFFIAINCSVNFFFYCVFGKKFRLGLKDLLRNNVFYGFLGAISSKIRKESSVKSGLSDTTETTTVC